MFDFLTNYYVSYLLVVAAVLFSLIASVRVKTTFSKYSRVRSSRGQTAAEIARQILDSNGLYNVNIVRVPGNLTDHYDPRTNIVALSQSVYDSTSVGSIGVAAHEVGHAIQYAVGYTPIKIRMTILPVAQFGSNAWLLLFILGVALQLPILREVGVLLFGCIVVFQIVTLPVEFNASSRAINTIRSQGILVGDELKGARKVLTAAAMTYVASMAVSLAQFLRLLSASRRD